MKSFAQDHGTGNYPSQTQDPHCFNVCYLTEKTFKTMTGVLFLDHQAMTSDFTGVPVSFNT